MIIMGVGAQEGGRMHIRALFFVAQVRYDTEDAGLTLTRGIAARPDTPGTLGLYADWQKLVCFVSHRIIK